MNTFSHKRYLIPKGLLPALILSLMTGLSANTSHAALSQLPLFLTVSVDPNVLINLSVEGPMGGAAYSDQSGNPAGCTGRKDNVLGDNSADNIGSCYFPDTEYLGYFDPNKCYVYSSGQFNPGATATSHACTSSSNGRWSGNFLNWASMTAIDEFIWSMTGGNRVLVPETTTATVVRRALSHPSWFPVKVINSTLNVAPNTVTPYTNSTLYIENSPPTSTTSGRVGAFKMNVGTTYASATSTTPDIGSFNINVKLCDTSTNKEANCTAYTTGGTTYYKPEGQLQKSADSKRFALTSYTADNAAGRQGGVLRSNMKYVGPQKPDGSGGMIANTAKEFGTDGLLIDDPEASAKGGLNTSNLNSGIINYINKFSDGGYKSYDPVSELFYESLRYFKNLGPTPENYGTAPPAEIIQNTSDLRAGGFWFYKAGQWDDPIQYSCQKNVILAINDAYPWLDKRLPGTAFTTQNITKADGTTHDLNTPAGGGSNDWGQPSNPDAINVKSLTDEVGTMENGRVYTPGGYTFNLNAFRVGGGNGTYTGNCTSKNISTTGLGSVMGTCPAAASDTAGIGRDNTYYVSGLAWYANTQDLRPGTSLPGNQTVTTYMIDTQEYSATPNVGPTNPLWLAGKYGGFIDSIDKNNPTYGLNNPNVDKTNTASNSEWDSDSDGEPDNYLLASSPLKLVTALNKAFSSIEKRVSSATSVATNSTRLDTGSLIYQAKFDTADWSGELLALDINTTTGAINTATPNWQASAQLPVHGSRTIYTYKPTAAAGARGILFQWANLTTDTDTPTPPLPSQQTYLNTLNGVVDTAKGTLRLDWLRGDSTNEKISVADTNTAHIFRKRTNILGDIINSGPVYVGTEDYGYGTLPSIGSSYTSFRATSTYKDRRPMIYAGANDGMLHGFNAKSTETNPAKPAPGQEIFAYIPNALFPELSKLTSPTYTHQYYVDGASAVGDVHDGTNWRTVLAGTTGAGARAVFGLDVTNPDAFGSSSVLWEFTSADNASPTFFGADLGYTLAQPSVVRMQDGSWAVIVGNGYNSENGHAVLFVLNAITGEVLQRIDTLAGSSTNKNGLSSPIAVDTDTTPGVDTVYAGDLYGNLWKFDVSGSAGSWDVAYKSGTVNQPLFTACSATTTCSPANRQPITTKPNIGKPGGAGSDQNNEGIMVYFGTGKYFETGDNIVDTGSQVQTFYGLWDQGSAITDRANLQEQTITYEDFPTITCPTTTPPTTGTCTSTKALRVVSKTPVCYNVTSPLSVGCTTSSQLKKGWALNLLKTGGVARGERSVSFPLVRRGLVVFSTLIPDPDPCGFGGKSFLMEVDALSGGEFFRAPFGTNGDNVVDSLDLILIGSELHSAAGVDLDIGVTNTPSVVESTTVDFKDLSGSSGSIAVVTDYQPTPLGSGAGNRRSWRQLK